ncbi:hypothetical protein B0I35DRAFT_516979 [Stachybotrys elegans]|uniref:LysM domain-containing protein n=1 Tax=Stachybotrys elegans TaxID=80388 RepID=A0A8K0WL31_9HYPO|nr:hypothetical protein B0I35DRAFT_516979 [Stachybotrys elegans]
MAQGISTLGLLTASNLAGRCYQFQTFGNLYLPTPTNVAWNQRPKYAGYAPGTRKDCEFYVQAPLLVDWMNDKYTSSCEDVAKAYDVPVDDFKTSKSSLKTNCTLSNNFQYCAVLSYEVATDPTEYCSKYVFSGAGYGCYDMAALSGVEFEQFALWNPSLGDNCASFELASEQYTLIEYLKNSG